MSAHNPPEHLAGLRPLSPKEQAQRVLATECGDQEKRISCTQMIWPGLFFDGTNNNKKRDQEKISSPIHRSHSNIVVLHDSFKDDRDSGYFRFYIPGVGTEFPEIGEKNESSEGKSMAAGGEARIYYGMIQLYNSVHYAVNKSLIIPDSEAESLVQGPSFLNGKGTFRLAHSRRAGVFNGLETKLKAAIKNKKPEVKLINLSVFGFSRGAAEARAFTTWMLECCKSEGGGLTFCGIPIRFQFLGLFDTVASVGMADSAPIVGRDGIADMVDGLMGWADGTLDIPPAVERCVHYVCRS